MNGRSILKHARQAFYGWRIVAAGGIAGALGSGLSFYGFSVFFLPISKSLELGRAATSLVFSLSRAEGAIEGPIAGYLIDRFGTRIMLFAGVLLMGLGYILLSQVNSFLTFLIVYMGIASTGFNAGVMAAPMAAINSWFIRRRGLAMGILFATFGLGGAVITPLLSQSVYHFGWRTTAVLAGFGILIILPVALIFRRSPESMGLLPDGAQQEPAPNKATDHTDSMRADYAISEALRTPTFWVLTLATALRAGGFTTLIVHFIPIMVWKGMDEQGAAFLLGTLAFLGIPTRILGGWMGDRIPKARLLAAVCAVGAVSIWLLRYAELGWQLWAFVLVFSIVESTSPLQWACIGDFFGRSRFATLRGLMNIFTALSAAVFPTVAGAIFDNSQSYRLALYILSVLMALSAVTFAILRPPPRPVR